jgi:hypothetical protein
LVIKDSKTNKKRNGSISKCENLDTIKLEPRTLARLKQCHFDVRTKLPETITYDELLNLLMDKVESSENKIMKVNKTY